MSSYKIIDFLASLGKSIVNFYKNLFKAIINFISTILAIFTPPYYPKAIYEQLLVIGVSSIPIVALTALFSGSVLALQSYVGFSRMSNIDSIPLIVVLSITRELGPVLTGLMVAGRVSSTIASEVGAMKVSEQIDAIYIMGIDINKYLLRPKLFAIIIFMPILTLIADVLGVFGGYLVSIYKLNYNPALYEKLTFDFLKFEDVMSGLTKASVFGIIIVIIGYYFGLKATTGASGVGLVTRNAVVSSTILILVANYFLTYWLFS